jgi:16S rRNA (adenine1518-N6/adenine1519-N6)-dimethyltransferase
VIEIGHGPGGLTAALLDAGAPRLVAVERDAGCVEALQSTGLVEEAAGRLRLVHDDARRVGLGALCDEEGIADTGTVKVVGNLPFSVGTRLLVDWLYPLDTRLGSFTLLFQVRADSKATAIRHCLTAFHRIRATVRLPLRRRLPSGYARG